MKKKNIKKIEPLENLFSFVKTLFLNGLFTILPIALTLFFINFVYGFAFKLLQPIKKFEPFFLEHIPGSEFLLATLIIFGIGIVLRLFIVHSIVHYVEILIIKIPLISAVYSSAKTLVGFFRLSKQTAKRSREVVLIQYPRKGSYHLAFLLESAETSYQPIIHEYEKSNGGTELKKYYKVFMPNSPNPTSGFFFILPEDEIIHTTITFEEGIKTLVSCGLVTPESLEKQFASQKKANKT